MVAGPAPALSATGLDVGYGRAQVGFGIDLELAAGTVGALVGTNGAGKSTILRALAGSLPAWAGRVRLFGDDVTRWSPQRRARHGLVLVAGGRATFPSLTVAETLRLAIWCRPGTKAPDTNVGDALALFPELAGRLRQRAGTLSGGEQQMLALARAMASQPRVLLIDELTFGLAPAIADRVLAAVVDLAGHGTTILLVEQDLARAVAVAGTVWFVQRGEIRYAGPPAGLAELKPA